MAAHPEPCRVLGLKLKPFALGHVELLNRVENVFVAPIDGQTDVPFDEVACGSLICSMPYEEGKALCERLLGEPDFAVAHTRRMREWGETGILPPEGETYFQRRKRRKRIATPEQLEEAALIFARYVVSGSHTINIQYEVPESDVRNEAPLHQIVKTHFLFNSCLTESQIMNRPWGLAQSEWMTHMAIQGLALITGEPGESEDRRQLELDAECVTEELLMGATTPGEILKRMRAAVNHRRGIDISGGGNPCAN